MNRNGRIALAAILGINLASGSLFAHHAFGSLFDIQRMHRLKGVVTSFVLANPHSLIFLDTKDANGQVEHWAIEGRPTNQWLGIGLDRTPIKVGDSLEVCGYSTKDGVEAFRSYTPPEPISLSLRAIPRETFRGRLIFPELLTLPGGKMFTWKVPGPCVDAPNVQ